MQEEENTIYAKWLSGELSPEELAALKANGDEERLLSLVREVDSWTLPDLKAEILVKIQSKLKKQEAVVVPMYRKPWLLAASVALLVALVWYAWPSSREKKLLSYSCNAGEVKDVVLPDQTAIRLYGKSSVAFDSAAFAAERKIELTGEAYFSVTKKGNFEVAYNRGTVHVLGTKFTILAGEEIASVKCYEGKVEVAGNNDKIILIKGEGARYGLTGEIEKYTVPAAMSEESADQASFENAPLDEVCSALELYYEVKFKKESIDMKRNYTGSYSLSNLDTALRLVFDPMNIAYVKNGNTILLQNK